MKKYSIILTSIAAAVALSMASPANAQTNIMQNNLLANGGLDSGGTGWSHTGGGGAYFYSTAVGSETDTIASLGWWDGYGMWQNTGATIQPGVDYVMTIRALVGQSPVTGVQLSFQDVTAGWTVLSNQNFTFPDQSTTWRIFQMYVSSNTLSGNVGDTIAAAATIVENPNTQYGWLWIDWMQLAPALPYFTNQVMSVTNYAGAPATLNGTAIGAVTNTTGPGSAINYQWYQAPSTVLANATNATLSFPVLNVTNSGTYYVIATGPYGSKPSGNFTLTVLPANPPVVTQPPVSQTAYVNQTVQFSVGISGTPPFAYQWKSNSIPITGATNSTFTLNNVSASSAAGYSVTITNLFGTVTANATLSVVTPVAGTYEAAVINLQPQVYLRFSGINNTNFVLNEGSLAGAANSTVEGSYAATTGPLPPSYPNFEPTNPAAQYDGSTVDAVIPALNLSTNTGNSKTISAWIYCYGQQAAYSGVVFERGGDASGIQIQNDNSGNNILSYDWGNGARWQFQSGLIIPQYQWCFVALVVTPTNATLYLQNGTSMQTSVDTFAENLSAFAGPTYVGWDSDGGTGAATRRFSGIIDEAAIFNRSLSPTEVNTLYSAATGDPAGIVTAPMGLTNYTGNAFQLSVVASGAPPLAYQWYLNNNAIAGATNTSYSVASAALTNSGNYYVHVQNTAGGTNSPVAVVSIQSSAPIFTALPQSQTIWSGVPATLSGVAAGSAPITYQWFSNNVPVIGQTNATLTIADPETTATYILGVSNGFGSTNSPGAVVTVQNPAQSVQMLYSTNNTGSWTMRNNYQPIQGLWFATGNKSRVVTHLGYFDSTGTGLLTNHWVGIYQGAPGLGTLLAQVQVPAGTTPSYYQGFRWVALSTPFVLQANTNYVLAASDNNWDLWPDAYIPTWNTAYVGANDGSTRYPMYDSALVGWPHEPNTPITSWGLNYTYGIFNLGAFPFVTSAGAGGMQLQWSLGTLMFSTNVSGPYMPVPGATSPFTMPTTNSAGFYRVQY